MMHDVRSLPLSGIVADEDYQPRADGLNRKHLELLTESDPSDWPPLLVTPQGDGTYSLIDGFHRLAEAERRGLTELPCRVIDSAGYPEAFRANLSHGLPLSRQDRRSFAVWLHDQHPDWSLRQIARECGLSHETVRVALSEHDSANVKNGQSDRGSRAIADHFRAMVRYVVRAEQSGQGRILGLFGNVRARHVASVIDDYVEEDRAAVAGALAAWGRACVEAAEPYLRSKSADRAVR